ncbi:GNAT family N-acyltransferase [Sulfitobacter sp. LCG007]
MLVEKGRYGARLARDTGDVDRAQALRARRFGTQTDRDCDDLDARCDHVLIEERATGALAGCFRVLYLSRNRIGSSYSARFYGLGRLGDFAGPMLEIGRFCLDPAWRDADILRVAWAAITCLVDRGRVTLLMGCSSFSGTDPKPYRHCFALLRARYLAPSRWQPEIAAPEIHPYARDIADPPDLKLALRQMPPLLRSYIAMGGWVSDHAVIDREMNTLHVFTGVEIAAIPLARRRLLRALA